MSHYRTQAVTGAASAFILTAGLVFANFLPSAAEAQEDVTIVKPQDILSIGGLEKTVQERADRIEKDLAASERQALVPESLLTAEAEAVPAKTAGISGTLLQEAYAVTIDGDPVVYTADQESAEKAVHSVLLQFVTEDELEQYEALEKGITQETGIGTKVTDISVSKEMAVQKQKAVKEEILTADEAVDVIQKGMDLEASYVVHEKESVQEAAEAVGIGQDKLIKQNPEIQDQSLLKKGTVLKVELRVPYFDVQVERETVKESPVSYKKKIVDDDRLLKGRTEVEQKGESGLKRIIQHTVEVNGTKAETESKAEIVKKPKAELVRTGTKEIPSVGSGSFAWPAHGGYISSKQGVRWGKLHKGIDIARPDNRTISAADHGTVSFAGTGNGYGNMVVIDHHNGFETTYAHLDSISVKQGQTVPKGSRIGVMGSTGHSTGRHLHFEIHKNGTLADPLDYVSQ